MGNNRCQYEGCTMPARGECASPSLPASPPRERARDPRNSY